MVATHLSVRARHDSGRLRADPVLGPLGLTATTSGDVPPGITPARSFHNGQPVTSWPLAATLATGEICSAAGELS